MDALTTFLQIGTCPMGGGSGWLMMFGWLGMVVILVLAVWLAVYAARRMAGPGASHPTRSTALDILQERYARGELTNDEFEERRRRILEGNGR